MNDTQTTAGSTDSQFGPTRNPQTPGGDTLSGTASNLQNTGATLNDSSSQTITSVGSSSFVPVDTTSTTTIAPISEAKPVNHHYPVIFGGAVLIVIILFATWLMTRKQKVY